MPSMNNPSPILNQAYQKFKTILGYIVNLGANLESLRPCYRTPEMMGLGDGSVSKALGALAEGSEFGFLVLN